MKLTDYLAIYGAGVSTATAVWNYLHAQSQVHVVLIASLQTIAGEYQHGVGIAIQNVSSQAVHITNISVLYPIRKFSILSKLQHVARFKQIPRTEGWCHYNLTHHGVEDGCPVSVDPGKSHHVFIRHEVVNEILEKAKSRRIKAVAQDALWRNTYSKAFDVR